MAGQSLVKAEPAWRVAARRGAARGSAVMAALALFAGAAALLLALASYHPDDAAMMTAAGGAPGNLIGAPGALLADILLTFIGPAAALMAPLIIAAGARLWRGAAIEGWRALMLRTLIGIVLIGVALALFRGEALASLPGGYGGALGIAGANAIDWALSVAPEPARAWVRGLLIAACAIAGVVLWARGLGLDQDERDWLFRRRDADAVSIEATLEAPLRAEPRAAPPPVEDRRPPLISLPGKAKPAPEPSKPVAVQTAFDLRDRFALPSPNLLTPPPPQPTAKLDRAALERNARLLETVLDDFHVKGAIVEVRPGPVVTLYELEPAPGVKASRVVSLAEDIARNMSALSARVATIAGRNVIGIELPNKTRETVSFRDMIESARFRDQGGLALILGKDISGEPVVADLAPMPHLLVAGTTGSGKSVGLNAMILSLLYRHSPDDCRLILIDPKHLELAMYEGIPHLLSPVVTDPAKAIRALKWAVEQMEERYRMMASIQVRGLAGFNDKVRAARAKGQTLGRRVQTGFDPDTRQPIYVEEELDYQPLPQIVVVVDELADLMLTAGKEVEILIQRLAQKARAAGIHLIMATQRPSVDVITGVIKANLPTRISFHVTSKIDSRTILGEQGAEQLLGKGDMLFIPPGRQLVRVHGPFVSDEEVMRVTDHWRGQGAPDYVQAVTEEPEDGGFALDGMPSGDEGPEEAEYRACVQVVAESQKASTSWLQRQRKIGYNRAARHIERMEKEGLVSKPDHVGRREVLMDEQGRPR